MKKLVICAQVLVLLTLCGCNATNNAGRLMAKTEGLDVTERAYKSDRSYYVDERGVQEDTERINRQSLAYKEKPEVRERALSERIEAVPGIVNAAVVINGHTAIIGILVQGNPKSDAILAIKKTVKELALAFDPELTMAAVTATPELYERITGASDVH